MLDEIGFLVILNVCKNSMEKEWWDSRKFIKFQIATFGIVPSFETIRQVIKVFFYDDLLEDPLSSWLSRFSLSSRSLSFFANFPLGFLCRSICFFKWSLLMNFLSHIVHGYNFSPLCVRTCRVSSSDRENLLLHSWHQKGFSPVCDLICVVRWLFFV